MDINFPSMQPKILEELGNLYDDLKQMKEINSLLQDENDKLKILVNTQSRKIEIIHALFNNYSRIVSENSRKIDRVLENKNNFQQFKKKS